MSQRLFNLLRERMASESVGLEKPVTVAELSRRLLPYHACRDALQFATKAEYDAEMLDLLADDNRLQIEESGLVEAVRAESRQPEPGLRFLHRFAASEVRLKHAEPPRPVVPQAPFATELKSVEECRSCANPLPDIEGARYCPECGSDQVIPTCSGCGAQLNEGWRYCALCGIVVDRDQST